MEKYNILKTIGDGTYGSVVKAMNMKTGNYFPFLTHFTRRDSGHQKNEKEIRQMGCLCFS